MEVKACRACLENLPKSCFTKNAAKKDGLSIYCRACLSERNRRNYQKHRSKRLAANKEHHLQNKEFRNAYTRQWRIDNNEHSRRLSREYKKKNLPRYLELNRRRKALLRGRLGEISDNIESILFESQAGRCYYCQRMLVKYHVEHKTPLSRGGLHRDANVCLSCLDCNLRKGTRTEKEFRDAV